MLGFGKPKKVVDPGFRDELGYNPNPLNQPTVIVDKDGWIACSNAQPQYDRIVLLRITDRKGVAAIGIGRRTNEIVESVKQERWQVSSPTYGLTDERQDGTGGITHWKPI